MNIENDMIVAAPFLDEDPGEAPEKEQEEAFETGDASMDLSVAGDNAFAAAEDRFSDASEKESGSASSEKTAIVTGASGGIGSAIASALAKDGYKVLLVYNTNKQAADALSAGINKEGGKAECFQADLSFPVVFPPQFSAPDVLVNCAGISVSGLFQDLSPEDWQAVMNANITGVYNSIHAVLSAMIERKSGSIINISSMWGEVGASCEAAYSASKGAVIALTKALAKELGPSGIRVNCVSPGCIDTAMLRRLGDETVASLAEETPLGRIGTPEDVAQAVAFLASEKASFITGQILGVNGGFVI